MDSKNPHHLKIEEWSDQRCLQIAKQDQFPAVVKDLQVQKHIISRYLNFYLGGKFPKGSSARDLTLAVIAIMPVSPNTEEFIWPESEYSDNGTLFFLTPDDKLKYDIQSLDKKRNDENNQENLIDEQFDDGTDSGAEPCMNVGQGDVTRDLNHDVTKYDSDTPQEPETFTNKDNSKETMDQSEVGQDSDTSSNVPSNFKPTPFVITTLKWYRLKRNEAPNNPPVEEEYGPLENAKFCIACNTILDDWESNLKGRIALKVLFALAALLVMRSKAKTVQKLTKYFSTQFVNSFFPGRLKCYTTPHRGFLKKSWKVFRETDPKNEIMFAKLVTVSWLHPTRLDRYGKNNILKFAVLSHTAYFGMGIINMLQQLASHTNPGFEIIFQSLYSDETAVSWNRVNDFFEKYLNEESEQFTFHWASIIVSKMFNHLSCSNNYELAVVIAVFIEKITKNSGVWQSAWVNKGSHLEKCKQLGYKLYNDYLSRMTRELAYTVEAL